MIKDTWEKCWRTSEKKKWGKIKVQSYSDLFPSYVNQYLGITLCKAGLNLLLAQAPHAEVHVSLSFCVELCHFI